MRLIDADALREGEFPEVENEYQMGWNDALRGAQDAAPTVDAVILPCKIGDDVYIIPSKVNFDLNVLSRHKEHNRVYHQNVETIVFAKNCWYMTGSADAEYGTGEILLDRYYKETWFLTREEAEAALDRMKG